MECIEPGRVVVGPGPDSEGSDYLAERLMGEFRGDFEPEYSIAHALSRHELEPPAAAKRGLPFVARVPEGAEFELAARLVRAPQVAAASPDYLVRPGAAIAIDDAAIEASIDRLGADPGSDRCGDGVVVAVLDSGVDPALAAAAALRPVQYDALDPDGAGAPPSDRTGHGSLVARLIGAVAPAAEIVSVRCFERTGTLSSVLTGLYLAQAAGPCGVINLSLSLSCAPAPCQVCNAPTPAAMTLAQLARFFATFQAAAPEAVLVAAGGNGRDHLATPAAFADVIAVGSFDEDAAAPISTYHQVPSDRFVLAPGGTGAPGAAYAERAGFAQPSYLHGASFAAAFVSGFAAKVLCGLTSDGCGTRWSGALAPGRSGPLAHVLGEIEARAERGWTGYDALRHGLGALRF